jgi:general stress protein YciG
VTQRTDPKRMQELGRAGGKASGEARRRRKKRSFLDAARALVTTEPERLVEQLASSPPGAVKLASILEKAGAFEPEPEKAENTGPTYGLPDLVALVARQGAATERTVLGFELTPAQRALALEQAAQEKHRNPASSEEQVVSTSSADEPPENEPLQNDVKIQPAAPEPQPDPFFTAPTGLGTPEALRELTRQRAEVELANERIGFDPDFYGRYERI